MGSCWAEGMNKTIAIEYERSKGEEGKWQLHDLEMMFEARSIMKDISRTNKNPAMSFARVETSDEDTYAAYTKLSNYWSTQTAAMITADSESAVEQIWQETQDYLRAKRLGGCREGYDRQLCLQPEAVSGGRILYRHHNRIDAFSTVASLPTGMPPLSSQAGAIFMRSWKREHWKSKNHHAKVVA